MQVNTSHIIVREATPDDNAGLIELTKQSPMQGVISLRIDRNPDFFSLLTERGESTVFLASKGPQIIGSFSTSAKHVWLNGEKARVHYLADFKVLPAYSGSRVAIRLAKKMYEHLQSQQADLLYGITAKGNHKVAPFFNGRLGLPAFIELGEFSIYQVLPSRTTIKKNAPYEISDHAPEGFLLPQFYNQFYRNYQLAPVLQEADLSGTINIFAIQDGKVKAVMSLLNTQAFKQYVVIDMSLFLKILVRISAFTTRFFGLFRLPAKGEPIQTLHVKYFAYEQGHEQALTYLLQRARNIGWDQKAHFISLGLHHKAPYRSLFQRVPKITFTSIGLITSLGGNQEKLRDALAGIPYEDFSLS